MDAQHHYRQQSVETANPAQLVSMLYHEAVATIVRAEGHLAEARLEGANHELLRAQAIVAELRSSLDFEQGGAIARNLDSLYDFCMDRLIRANISKDGGLLAGARTTLADLAATWDQMVSQMATAGRGVAVAVG